MALKLALGCGDTNSIITLVETLGDKLDPEVANALAAHMKKAEYHSHAAALLASAGNVCISSLFNELCGLREGCGVDAFRGATICI